MDAVSQGESNRRDLLAGLRRNSRRVAAGEYVEIARFQFENDSPCYPPILAGSRPHLFCKPTDQRLSLREWNVTLKRVSSAETDLVGLSGITLL